MELGIGLPNAVPDVDGESLLGFARRADELGFASIVSSTERMKHALTFGRIERLVKAPQEPIPALAAAAAVSTRARLGTTILVGSLRQNTAMLANQARTIGSLSGGRFALAIAIAASEDDYAGDSTVPGRAPLDRQLEEMKRIWKGRRRPGGASEAQGTAGPSLIVGGTSDAALEHVARFGEGWIMGSCSPAEFTEVAARAGDAWSQAGREGEPRKLAVGHFSLGAEARATADHYVDHYYSWAEEYAPRIKGNTVTSEEELEEFTKGLADAGCDELILFPVSKDPEQLDLLAKALGSN